MALNFPNSPVDGQIYYDTVSGAKYVWVAASSKWKSMQYTAVAIGFGYQHANAAYDTVNAAFAMANAAYNVQNVDFTLSNSAFLAANLAFDSANSNWTVQNALYTLANTAYASINSNWVVTNAAFGVANAALPNVSNAVFAGNLRVTGNLQIGSNTITITNNHIIANDYYRMNTGGHMVAVTDGNIVNTVFTLVNVCFDTANASYNSANNVGPQIAPTYNTANAAYSHSNTRFASAGGTISGAVEITGDLTVHGNTTFVDQQSIRVGDPLIYLAANNYASDVVDIGFVANYVNATSSNVHTGLFRSSGTKEYYLFYGYDKEPINNYIDPTGNNISMAVLNSTIRTSNLILGGTNTINWITSNYITTNTAYASINSNWTVTNATYTVSNSAFALANVNAGTISGIANGSVTINNISLSGTINPGTVNIATQTLTDSANVSWNVAQGVVASVTLGGNRNIDAPTNLKVGTLILHIVQDGTGGRTLTWNSKFKWPAGVAPVLSSSANAKDIFSFIL